MRRLKRGMTLVEVLVAFAILLAGLVGILALLATGLRAHKRAINETEASQTAATVLAEARAEFARGRRLPGDTPGKFHPCPDFPDYKYNRHITALDRAGLEYFVRVEVRWADQGQNQSLVVQTIMFRNTENMR